MNTKEQLEVINQQIRELAGIYREAVSHFGVSENEFWIWYTLVIIGGEYSQQDICGIWSLSKQTVNTIVSNMVKKNYVVLETVPGTRNRKTIRLTAEGAEYGRRLVTPISEAEQRALNRLLPNDRMVCIKVMENYIGFMREEFYGNKSEK